MTHWVQLLIAGALFQAITGQAGPSVGMIELRGAIGPNTVTYIGRAIDVSAQRDDACLIIQLDTPGGAVPSTMEIVRRMDASPVPVVVYVAPSFSTATSAGTFITIAADIAAMAPNTSIGSAHPVGVNGEGNTNEIMWSKAENVIATWARTVAEKHGRNTNWVDSAVRNSVSITSEEAVKLKVVDLIAKDVPDLLKAIDKRQVRGKSLDTAGAMVVAIPMTVREKFLHAFLRPEVMFVLMLIVIYGVIGELSSPGAILPGVAGAIALILVLYMSSVLPVRAAGLALLGLALILFIVDIFTPTHGVLTGGGIISFFLGALMLFDRSEPAFRLSLWVIIPATALTALFFLFFVGAGLRAQQLPIRAGHETMLGQVVPALERIDAQGGRVFIEGELWKAVSDVVVEKDQPVEVVGIEGLVLKVKPKNA